MGGEGNYNTMYCIKRVVIFLYIHHYCILSLSPSSFCAGGSSGRPPLHFLIEELLLLAFSTVTWIQSKKLICHGGSINIAEAQPELLFFECVTMKNGCAKSLLKTSQSSTYILDIDTS